MQLIFRFLIIEESMASRIVIRDQFSRLNQHVDLVSTMDEALERITFMPYDMILIDSHFYHLLRTMNFTSSIPEHHKMTPCPFIGILANNNVNLSYHEVAEDYLYFSKPFSPEKTVQIIDYLKASLNSSRK